MYACAICKYPRYLLFYESVSYFIWQMNEIFIYGMCLSWVQFKSIFVSVHIRISSKFNTRENLGLPLALEIKRVHISVKILPERDSSLSILQRMDLIMSRNVGRHKKGEEREREGEKKRKRERERGWRQLKLLILEFIDLSCRNEDLREFSRSSKPSRPAALIFTVAHSSR